jgi:hypothetical protein
MKDYKVQEDWQKDELQKLYEGVVKVDYYKGDLHFSMDKSKLTDGFKLKGIQLYCKLYNLDY